jgi:hypothetical protein
MSTIQPYRTLFIEDLKTDCTVALQIVVREGLVMRLLIIGLLAPPRGIHKGLYEVSVYLGVDRRRLYSLSPAFASDEDYEAGQ